MEIAALVAEALRERQRQSSAQVWVIEILSPRDDFKSYLAGRDGPDDFLWVEDPADAVHFASRRDAERVAANLGLHGHERVVTYAPTVPQMALPLEALSLLRAA